MAHYAAEGVISQALIEGGIEISAEQYAAGLAGMLAGKLVTIDGGFAVIDPPVPPEPDKTDVNIANVPSTLFGGPTIGEVFNGY